MNNEFGAFAKEVYLELDINPNTLRRWSSEIEKHGYKFVRNEKNQRLYFKQDFLLLMEMKKILEKTQNLELSAKTVVKNKKEKEHVESAIRMVTRDSDEVILTKVQLEELAKKIATETAERVSQEMIAKLKYILDERNANLVEAIEDTLKKKRK